MTQRTRIPSSILLACVAPLALAAVAGCGQLPDEATADPFVGALTSGPSETCGTATPAATITGNGSVRSSASYNPSTCARAYLLDVNNYSPGIMGTLIGYGSVAPTTEEECTRTSLRTYVWQRSGSTATFLGNKIRKGAWVSDGFGGMRCATPSVDITAEFPSWLVRGGNYRFAVRASILPPADNTVAEAYKKVLVDIPAPVVETSPRKTLNILANLEDALTAQPSGSAHPAVGQLWAVRDKPISHGVLCRSWQVLLSAYRVTAIELKTIIPSAQAALADQRSASLQGMRNLICNNPTPGPTDIITLQSFVITDLSWGRQMQAQVMDFLGVGATTAANLIAQSFVLGVQRLARRCGAVPEELTAFVNFGTLPAGKLGADLLQRNCTGSRSEVAAAAGIGVDTGGDRRTKFNACMQAQSATLAAANQCSGPTSSSPTNADPNDVPADRDGPCRVGEVWIAPSDSCEPSKANLTADQRKTLNQENENFEESTRRSRAFAEIGDIHFGVAGAFGATSFLAGTTVAGAPAAVGLGIVAALEALQGGLFKIISSAQDYSAERSLETICRLDRLDPRCGGGNNNRCVEYDLRGKKAWFQTAPTTFFPDGRQTSQFDTFQDCACELFERDYGSLPGSFVFGGPTSWCNQTAEERQIQECQRNPEGPNDKPKPECIKLLQPKEVDRDTMLARWCKAKMPNCPGAYGDDTGACACPGGGNGFPVAGLPNCPNANASMCDADSFFNERTCQCVSYNSGLGCAKGGVAGYLSKNPGDVFAATFPQEPALASKNFLMVASGNTPIVTTGVKMAGLKDRPELALTVRLPTPTVSSGFQGWAAQISCTNEGRGIQNRSIKTVQFQGLSPGLHTIPIPMTAADRSDCFNNDLTETRFEIRSNNQLGQPLIGYEDFVATNAMRDRTGMFPVDPCNVPTPSPTPSPFPPPDPLPFTQVFDLTGWTFSDGILVQSPVRR